MVVKVSDMTADLLPEFQKYLSEKKLALDKYIPFPAYWVSRFLGFAKRRDY